MPRSVLSRATDAVANRLDRRSFLARSAMIGSALVTAPADLLLHPKSAYAAVCSCLGQSCECGSLCCDGYTEFCCAIYGMNACPTGSLTGGWWKADGSSFCGGAARYYMDCHKPCGSCGCGGSGLCRGSCNGTACGCGNGRCDHRKAGCTSFRYGNCSNNVACIGPIQCRVVTCTEPWRIEPTCSSSAVRTDNNTRNHNRPCLQATPRIHPIAGDWAGTGIAGIGFYANDTGQWVIRNTATSDNRAPVTYGREPGDLPVVGDWNGDGRATVGIFRRGQWHLSDTLYPTSTTVLVPSYGAQPGDVPVAGDWTGDGKDDIGIFRSGQWHLSLASAPAKTFYVVPSYGKESGDIPVVGDWDGDGRVGIGIFRQGEWHLSDTISPVKTVHRIRFGVSRGDVPVVGDWTGRGRDSIGIYRPTEGRWYLRESLADASPITVTFGQRWV